MSTIDLYQISLKAIIKNSRGEVLCLKMGEDSAFAGYYDLPGGRIDEVEVKMDFQEILLREIHEELGESVVVKVKTNPVAVSRGVLEAKSDLSEPEKHVLYLFFEADFLSGDIVLSDEHKEYSWLEIQPQSADTYFTAGMLAGINNYLHNASSKE
jgi:8-oxo-dGTP pyrophosphatase MutT (NUDIX family)